MILHLNDISYNSLIMFIVFLFHYRGGPVVLYDSVISVVSVTSASVSASDHLHLM